MKLEELKWSAHPDADDVLVGIDGCTVSVLVRGRNAWHSTWVRHWFRNSHLFADHHIARRGAEPLRGPGSVFYVRDRPALVLSGVTSRVVVFDGFGDEPFAQFHGVGRDAVETPFGRYLEGIFAGVTLREAADYFRAESDGWASGFRTDNHVRFATVPGGVTLGLLGSDLLDTAESYPQGSGYLLGWNHTSKTSVATKSILRQIRTWAGLVEPLGSAEVLPDRLRHRFDSGGDPARSRAALRERYDIYRSQLVQAVADAEAAHDAAQQVTDNAWLALDEAETFAADPWANVLRSGDMSSAEIRAARERATNSQLLLEQAQAFYDAADTASDDAWQRLCVAEEAVKELEEL